jgi:hypothetical protein
VPTPLGLDPALGEVLALGSPPDALGEAIDAPADALADPLG